MTSLDIAMLPGDLEEELAPNHGVDESRPLEGVRATVTAVRDALAPAPPVAPLSCPFCSFVGRSESGLTRHQIAKHGAPAPAESSSTSSRPASKFKRPSFLKTKGDKKDRPKTEKRLNGNDILAGLITGLGMASMRVPGMPISTATMLMWEAPLLAKIADAAAAGTIVDTAVIQPFARAEAASKGAGAAIMLPLCAGAIEKRPELYRVVYPFARMAAQEVLLEMIPILEQQKREEERIGERLARLGELMGDATYDEDAPPPAPSPVDMWLSAFLPAPPPPPPTPT